MTNKNKFNFGTEANASRHGTRPRFLKIIVGPALTLTS